MALNLNKGGEENPKPFTEKKGLNLSKSEDSPKTGLNLSKEETVPNQTTTDKSGVNEPGPKKKNPVMFILLTVLIVGGGLFWFLNKGATSPMIPDDFLGTSLPKQETKPTADNTLTDQSEASNTESETNSTASVESAVTNNTGSTGDAPGGNEIASSTSPSSKGNQSSTGAKSGSIEDIAKQVVRGDFGNGKERKLALGAEYDAIQAKVNELYKNGKNE